MSEAMIRGGSFLLILGLMLWAERRWPRRSVAAVPGRIPSNLGLVVLDQLVVRLLVPVLPAVYAASLWGQGAGLFGGLPWGVAFVLSLLAFDAAIWAQHALFHRVPILWRLHRMHHADTGYDTTTALRFHPLEILLSVGIKVALVRLMGPPPEAVIAFEVILNGMAMFNHANLAIPERVDGWLRTLVVTPDVHRVHHSSRLDEMHHNFGFNLVIWDRLFGTYKAQPKLGHEGMEIGLPCFREDREHTILGMLTQPFHEGLPTRAADAAACGRAADAA